MPNSRRIHVVRRDGEWKGRREGARRASAVGSTQASVEKRVKQIAARAGGAEVIVHRPNGVIRDSDTIPHARESRARDRRH